MKKGSRQMVVTPVTQTELERVRHDGDPALGHVSVAVREVHKSFAGNPVLRGVDFSVREGELIALLGPSGCGKTTMLRSIGGLESIDSGEIQILGRTVATAHGMIPPNKRGVGFMFQSYALWPHLSVYRNIEYGLKVAHVPREMRRPKVDEILEMVGLSGLGSRLPSALSGGQQQRVALARSLVVRPGVLLMDEPLSNLDATLRDRMREEIRDLVKAIGTTCLYVTHDQKEALAISDRVFLMNRGELVQDGAPEELYQNPNSVFAAEFIGNSNLLRLSGPPTANAGDGSVRFGEVSGLGRITARRGRSGPDDAVWYAAVRPDEILVRPADRAEPGSPNRWLGTITGRIYDGASSKLSVQVGSVELKAIGMSGGLAAGEQAWVEVPPDAVSLLPGDDPAPAQPQDAGQEPS
jgi:iron(III) transport system ATP-binding protein